MELDLYTTILEGILKVDTTGDIVSDTVWLLVLPLVVLFLFSRFVTNTIIGGSHKKLDWIFMFIVFFAIIDGGYYPAFVLYSKTLLVITIILSIPAFFRREDNGTVNSGLKKGSEGRLFMGAEASTEGLNKSEISHQISLKNDMIKKLKKRIEDLEKKEREMETVEGANPANISQQIDENYNLIMKLESDIHSLEREKNKPRNGLI